MKKWKCTICNYIHEGDGPPEECPICGADKSVFIEVTEGQEEAPEQSTAAAAKTDTSSGRRWKCTICNYIHEGEEPPDECPVCGADSGAFIEIDREEKAEDSVPQTEGVAVPGVGEVEEEKAGLTEKMPPSFGILGSLIMKLHLHAISVHTPNGVIPVAIVFLLLALYFNIASLEFASFFNLIFVLLTMPVVVLTGIISWQIKYRGANTWVFKTKLACSAIVTVLLSLMVFWRFIDSAIGLSGGTGGWVYLGLGLVILIAAGVAGHLGGTLVHGK